MKAELNSGPRPEETDEPPWREVVLKLLGSKEDVRPVITCECALWGSPCPHSLWSGKSATTAKAN
jgi:hypothetical protein